ncbi:helix-turn-helix transcriptional regulator [Streptococcus anginosus]|nr:helix-turn-helix transcriptional regulator [Streptococcus anginosus]MCW1051357.1 helix-turn-helix transcriptional regulator [Streptococcus anginosus]
MLPQRLKALRKEAGLTQKELADKLNISQAAYAQWENGVKKPARENLTTLANILDTSIDYLLDNTNSEHPEDDLSNVEILFRKTSKNMTPEQKEIFKKELLEFMEIRRKAFEEDEQ